jgi:hypothetical protein
LQARLSTLSDSAFFVGTVALLNSLRLTGNESEFVVLDCGLTEAERAALEAGGAILIASPDRERHPWFLKPYAATLRRGTVEVLIDSDMIVTSSLAPLIELAGAGAICVFPDHESDVDRWFPEWHELFGLRAPLRREPYVNSGFVAFSSAHWPQLAERWHELCSRIPALSTRLADPTAFAQPDQDALNALLMSEIPGSAVHRLPPYEWNLRRVVVEDATSLTCVADGKLQPLLHAASSPKVWQSGGWTRVGANAAYMRLLPRLLLDPGLTVRLSSHDVPPWVRHGVRARILVGAATVHSELPIAVVRARRAPHRIIRDVRTFVASLRDSARPPAGR